MKKVLFFIMIFGVLFTSCKKKESKSTSLNYTDSNPISMTLSGPEHISNVPAHYFDHQIEVTSDYSITYSAINPDSINIIKVSSDGYLHGKNVGSAKVKIDNGYENLTVRVDVSLFREPTFDFGCNTSKIKSLYGSPYQSAYLSDTVLVYQYTADHGYSWACGEMDFFFDVDNNKKSYFEADVYISKTCKYLLDSVYLKDNFTLEAVFTDSIIFATYGDTLFIYRSNFDNDLVCGKFATHNQWNESCLFYIQDIQEEKSVANLLKRRPRSSKLRY